MRSSETTPTYFAHVDGLRALAVLSVMLYHLNPGLLPGGFMGVDIFFVISGFVVTASLAGHQSETPRAFLATFYARRLARLVPALVIMLVVTTALYVLFVPRAWFNRAAETVGQAAFLGLSNWTLDGQVVNYFEPRAELNPFTHTWSLGVEEQFYLIAPLFLFFALGSRSRPRAQQTAIMGIAALALLSLATCYYFGITRGSRFVFYQITFRFWELAGGVVLFLVGRRITTLPGPILRMYGYSGWMGLALVALAMLLPKPGAYPWVRSTIAVAGALLLVGLPAIERRDRLQPVLASPAALWVGHRSYSLYLWHWPVYVLMRWTTGLSTWPFKVIAVVTSFALAALCHALIENPVRYSAALRRRPPAMRITAMLVLLGAGWLTGRMLLTQEPALGLGLPARHPADWYPNYELLKSSRAAARMCNPSIRQSPLGDAEEGMTEFIPEDCVRRSSARLFVIGDSHAMAYLPMFEQLSAEQGRMVTVLEVPGCGYVRMMSLIDPKRNDACYQAAHASMQVVLERARPGDIVFLSSLRVPRLIELGGRQRAQVSTLHLPHGDVYGHTPEELGAMQRAVLDAPRWFVPFLKAGLHVVFELPKPVLRAHPYQCVDWFNRNNPDCAGGLSERRTDQERYRQPVVNGIRELVAAHAGVTEWDPLPRMCDDMSCPAMRGGHPLFFDGDHVSPYGNLVLLPSFGRAIDELEATR